jgi:hypothetical protein
VVKNIRTEDIQPHWLLVGDEVHAVAFIGQRFPEFRRQNTTSAKGWVTNNPDSHNTIFIWYSRFRLQITQFIPYPCSAPVRLAGLQSTFLYLSRHEKTNPPVVLFCFG